MSTISNRMPEVTIEYTSRNKRVTKHFTDAYAGRRFFATKLKDGKEPKVVNKQQTKLEQLKAMPIIGNAYHDSARFALCNEIIFDTTLSVEDRHEALVEIERTMGLEELTPTTSLEKKLEEVEQYILDTQ